MAPTTHTMLSWLPPYKYTNIRNKAKERQYRLFAYFESRLSQFSPAPCREGSPRSSHSPFIPLFMDKEKPPMDLIIPGPTLDPPPLDDPNNPNPGLKPRKKKRGPMYFIKVALFMIKTGSDKSKGFSGSKSKSLWSKLVGSVRPLHLQLQQVPDPEAAKLPALTHQSPARTEFSEDYLFSPSEGSSRSATDTPYSSAVGLNELAQSEEEDEPEGVPAASDHWNGDEMIDAKAEEFIANFYNEMKLQRRHSINERSLR